MNLNSFKQKGPYTEIGIGATVGLFTGFITMRIGKLAAIAVGSSILILEIAQMEGLIKFDWSAIPKLLDMGKQQMSNKSSIIEQALDFAITNMAFTTSFIGGVFIGIGLS
ncbi:FUN14 domain-containing protein 1-like [Stomoxys calcitrans]|uniref:FUN14 domain-containing protein 1-like n=1 Tax=Stomoxys calcitrans TaxID=35570 RepID=UPI0027E23A18|nr:FUN14 domain-containing protein 1-like [Stomoxys calcitrans]